jgi:glycosyltransferase involved in cell wall biosynthesis
MGLLMYRDKKVAVVVPAYNEEMLVKDAMTSVPDYVDKIYAVNDCSTDKTAEIIEALAKDNLRIKCISHEKNKGVGATIVTGYRQSLEDQMDVIAVMAGDNQMDPTFLESFLDPIIDGRADYTKGNRLLSPESRKGMSRWRFFGNSMLTFLTKVSSGYWQMVDPQNGYTAISRQALEKIDLDSVYPRYGYCNNMLCKLNVQGLRVMDIGHPARYGNEKSKIRYGNYIVKVSNLLLSDFLWRLKVKYTVLSFHPLVLFYLFGIVLSILGLLGGLYSLYYKFVLSGPIFEKGILALLTFIMGVQFLLFAMVFDMQHENGIKFR